MNEDVCYVELMTDLKSYAEKLGYKFEGGSMINQEFTVAGYWPNNKFKIVPLRFTHEEKEIKYRYDIPFWEFNILNKDPEYYEDFIDRIYNTLKRLRDGK